MKYRGSFFIGCANSEDPVLLFAAQEMQKYLALSCGTGLEIRLGEGSKEAAFFLDVQSRDDELERDGFSISVRSGRVQLTGGSPRGTLYSVYAFLEEYLGCRWFYPGEDLFPKHSPDFLASILSQQACKHYVPCFRVRMLRFLVYDLGPTGTALAEAVMKSVPAEADWMAKNRMNVFQFALDHNWNALAHWRGFRESLSEFQKRGITVGVGGHCAFMFMNPGEAEEHPEWFPCVDGKPLAEDMFCTNNEEAVRHYVEGLREFIDNNPEIGYFAPWPNDNAVWCRCDKCRDVPVADRYMRLAMRISREVKSVRPDLEVTHFIYGTHMMPPEKERPEGDMTLTLCMWGRDLSVPFADMRTSDEFRNVFERWREMAVQEGIPLVLHEKYARHLGFGPRLLPVPVLAEDTRYFKSRAVDGFELPMAYMGRWVKGLNLYTLAKLMWDTEADPELILSDYFREYYGAISGKLREAYEVFEGGFTDWSYWDNNMCQNGFFVEPERKFAPELKAYCDSVLAGISRCRVRIDEATVILKEHAGNADEETCDALRRRLQNLVEVVDYTEMEWCGLKSLIEGAELLGGLHKAEARRWFEKADRLERAREKRAADPEQMPLHWDATGNGPYGVFAAGSPRSWLKYTSASQEM